MCDRIVHDKAKCDSVGLPYPIPDKYTISQMLNRQMRQKQAHVLTSLGYSMLLTTREWSRRDRS